MVEAAWVQGPAHVRRAWVGAAADDVLTSSAEKPPHLARHFSRLWGWGREGGRDGAHGLRRGQGLLGHSPPLAVGESAAG